MAQKRVAKSPKNYSKSAPKWRPKSIKNHQKSSLGRLGSPPAPFGLKKWSRRGVPPKIDEKSIKNLQKTQTIFLKTMLRVRIFRQRTSQRALKNAPDFSAEFRSARAQNRAQILELDHEKKPLSQSGTGSPHKYWTPRRSTPWHGGGSALCAFRYALICIHHKLESQ